MVGAPLLYRIYLKYMRHHMTPWSKSSAKSNFALLVALWIRILSGLSTIPPISRTLIIDRLSPFHTSFLFFIIFFGNAPPLRFDPDPYRYLTTVCVKNENLATVSLGLHCHESNPGDSWLCRCSSEARRHSWSRHNHVLFQF